MATQAALTPAKARVRLTARLAAGAAVAGAVTVPFLGLLLVEGKNERLESLDLGIAGELNSWALGHPSVVRLLLVLQDVLNPNTFRALALVAAIALWRSGARQLALWAVVTTAAGALLGGQTARAPRPAGLHRPGGRRRQLQLPVRARPRVLPRRRGPAGDRLAGAQPPGPGRWPGAPLSGWCCSPGSTASPWVCTSSATSWRGGSPPAPSWPAPRPPSAPGAGHDAGPVGSIRPVPAASPVRFPSPTAETVGSCGR